MKSTRRYAWETLGRIGRLAAGAPVSNVLEPVASDCNAEFYAALERKRKRVDVRAI